MARQLLHWLSFVTLSIGIFVTLGVGTTLGPTLGTLLLGALCAGGAVLLGTGVVASLVARTLPVSATVPPVRPVEFSAPPCPRRTEPVLRRRHHPRGPGAGLAAA